MSQVIEKRPYDKALIDVDCSEMLAGNETITTVNSVTTEPIGLGVTTQTPTINQTQVTAENGLVIAAGKVIQFFVDGGLIPKGSDSMKFGVPNVICLLRVRFSTSAGQNLEATCRLLIKDQPT